LPALPVQLNGGTQTIIQAPIAVDVFNGVPIQLKNYFLPFHFDLTFQGAEEYWIALAMSCNDIECGPNGTKQFYWSPAASPGDGAVTQSSPQHGGQRNLNDLAFGFYFTEPDSVPEPSTWAMMILSFGLCGSMLRRRRLSVSDTH
jgi:hypothetical protein